MKEFRFLFLKLNIWLCLASSFLVVISAKVLSTPVESVWLGIVMPPLLFYFIYVEDRCHPSPEDGINEPRRTLLVKQYQKYLHTTAIGALLVYESIAVYLIVVRSTVGLVWILLAQIPLVVLVAYDQIKKRPGFDSIAVGGTWAFVIVFAVSIPTGRPIDVEILGVFLGWFLIAAAGVESRNIGDAVGDIEAKKATVAGILGPQKARILVGTLKGSGVLTFLLIGGPIIAAAVLGYLFYLWMFRWLTDLEDERIRHTDRPMLAFD